MRGEMIFTSLFALWTLVFGLEEPRSILKSCDYWNQKSATWKQALAKRGGIERAEKREKEEKFTEKELRSLRGAKEYLRELEKQRDILVGDFFGLNITARRYDLVFDRLGYIRYRIKQVDEEIARVKAFLRHE
ncbi:MAG: hypothetical protein QHH14_08745 [Clostridiales bacterium]|jgi:hypothetical protein|nr:hypothetical protein [Clostridiales bacterium]